ncbi:MAG TPA: response regulator [Thermodesulfobacteriota bacterium]|nr:response regulator [Thermodesulfobacteriota bacterium]
MDNINSVMILDDEPIVCERLRSTLEKVKLDIETFTNPNEAVKRFGEKKFQVLITDLKMKEMDGIEVLKLVQKVSPETRVIIITGFATVEKAREALKIGAYDFIAKPFKLSQLRDLVIKALGLAEQD